MVMGKHKMMTPRLWILLTFGLLLLVGGLVAMYLTAALNPATTTPGEELDLVSNLYYRRMTYVNGQWQPGTAHLLGRYVGGYVVGMQRCNSYTKTAVTLPGGEVKQAFVCDPASAPGVTPPQGPVTSAGFGILYQDGSDNHINLLIPLPCTYLKAQCSENWMKTYKEKVLPWFQYGLKKNSNPAGHEFELVGALGGETGNDPSYGYVSLEIKNDLENLD